MKFHQLLQQRDVLLRQAHLANVAFAYQRLRDFAGRIARAGLRGAVTLRAGDAEEGHPWPALCAETGSQAVIEEHFLDEDIVELADILAFLNDGAHRGELRFRLEDLATQVAPRLRRELEAAGVLPAFAAPGAGDGDSAATPR